MDTVQKANEHYFNVLQWALKEQGIEVYNGSQFTSVNRAARLLEYSLTLVNPFALDKAMKMAEPVALQCQSDGVMISRHLDKLNFQITLPESLWLNYYRGKHTTGLGIGVNTYGEQIDYDFEQPNSIMIGAPGAGKTYASIASLIALFDTYTPDDMRAVICDYHGDMNVLKNEEHLFRFEWGTIADTMDTTVRAIQWVYNMFLKRIETQDKEGLRILLFVDEVEAVAEYDKETLKRLVAIGNEGRKFKVNLLVTAKHPTQSNLSGLMPTITNRFVGKINMGRAAMTRFVGQPMQAMYLTKKGDFVHSDTMDISRFLVVRVENKDIKNLKRLEASTVPIIDEKYIIEYNDKTKVGRPEKPWDFDLLAFLYNVGPDTFSKSLISKEWNINSDRVLKHKNFIIEFAQRHLVMRKIAKKYPKDWHPQLFNDERNKEIK